MSRRRQASDSGGADALAEARRALQSLAAGDFSVRLPATLHPAVSEAFNQLTSALAFLEQASTARPTTDLANAETRRPAPCEATSGENRTAYVAMIAVDTFRGPFIDLDLRAQPDAVEVLSERIGTVLEGAILGRVAPSTLDLRFLLGADEDPGERLLHLAAALEAPVPVKGGVALFKTTIGYAPWPSQSASLPRAMANAEFALSKARSAHLKLASFTDRDRAEAETRWELISDLSQAASRNELSLRFQPKLNLRSNRIEGVEALMRWLHPQRGFVPPDQFIWLAERTGQIEGLTRFALQRAVADQSALRAAGHIVAVHVNISGQLIADAAFVDWAIATATAAEGRIGFEITETAVIDDPERSLRHLRRIADAGIDIAIDDYGVGLSSLTYLKQFPAKELKIDRAFITGLTASHRDPLIVRSTIDLAHALDMEITAEGVEDEMTQALLQVMGCDQIQGFHLSKPVILDELCAFLDQYGLQQNLSRPAAKFAGIHKFKKN